MSVLTALGASTSVRPPPPSDNGKADDDDGPAGPASVRVAVPKETVCKVGGCLIRRRRDGFRTPPVNGFRLRSAGGNARLTVALSLPSLRARMRVFLFERARFCLTSSVIA